MTRPPLNIGYLGFGSYLPPNVLTNAHLEKMVDTTDEWIVQRTGIHERRIMGPEDSLLNMAVSAARQAITDAGIDPQQISDIHVGTNTHFRFPALATMVQEQLGIDDATACDVSAGCSAFVFSVEAVYQRMMSEWYLEGKKSYSLVIGADGMSLIMDWKDRATCVLFGDGAGAVVVGPTDNGGILATNTRTMGKFGDLLYSHPLVKPTLNDSAAMTFDQRDSSPFPNFEMEGRKVFAVAVRSMMADIKAVIEKYNRISGEALSLDDIEYVIPHQANHRIVSAVAEGLKLPLEQVYENGVRNYGNTSAATIPIGYAETRGKRPGALEVDVAFGAGFASGAILRRNPK